MRERAGTATLASHKRCQGIEWQKLSWRWLILSPFKSGFPQGRGVEVERGGGLMNESEKKEACVVVNRHCQFDWI